MGRKKGVVYSYALMLVEVISTLFVTPFIIRLLGQSEYGVYQLINSIVSYLALLDLGVGNAIIRYMTKYRVNGDKPAQEKTLGITTIFYTIIAAISIIAGIVIYIIFPTAFSKGLTQAEIELARKLLIVSIASTAIYFATSSFATTLLAYERFATSKGISILFTIVRVIGIVVVLKFGYKSFGVVMIYAIANIATRLFYVGYVLVILKLKPDFRHPDFKLVKEICVYTSFVLLQMIAIQVNSMTDTILIGALVKNSAAIIAIYSVGAQIVQYFKTVGGHMTGVIMPGVVKLVEGGANAKQMQDEMVRIGRILFMMLGMVFCVFIVFGKDFVVLWAGQDYSQGYMVAVLIMIPTMFSLIQLICSQMLQAMFKHKKLAVVQIVSALLNIVLTALLIKWQPLTGAVIGSVIALSFGDIICVNIMMKREIGVKLTEYYFGLSKGIVPSLIISVAVGYLFNLLNLNQFGWVGFVANCAVMVIAYGICMLWFGMNKSEKDMIKNTLAKFHITGDK